MTFYPQVSPQASELKFITRLHQYEQLISEPKRVTKNTRTLTDHWYTTNPYNIISKGNAKIIECRVTNISKNKSSCATCKITCAILTWIQIYLGRFGRINSSESGLTTMCPCKKTEGRH